MIILDYLHQWKFQVYIELKREREKIENEFKMRKNGNPSRDTVYYKNILNI